MRVFSLNMGADTGGVSIATRRAFRDVAGWTWRSMVSSPNYIGYKADLAWDPVRLRLEWLRADVLHFHNNWLTAQWLELGWKRVGALPRRPHAITYHGTGFREDPEPFLVEQRRREAIGTCTTLDIWLMCPAELTWVPHPVNAEAMSGKRHLIEDDVIRIAHAPTNRQIKSTEALIAAVKQLQDEGHPVELDLIEGQTWDTCLERKAQADIYFDQVLLGYGNNAIECWGMGIPVVCGAQPATLAEMERRFGELPFYRATEETIYAALKALVQSSDLRAEYAEKGLAHVRRFHDEAVVVAQLQDVYTRAAGSKVRAA